MTPPTPGGDGIRVGDGGRMDADRCLFIADRLKDMIISGGENVYPAEVEAALRSHAAVADAAAIGVPDERWGKAVHAVVVLRASHAGGEAALSDELGPLARRALHGRPASASGGERS